MIHRISATLAPDLARTASALTKTICGRPWYGLALACVLLAGCAGTGASPPVASEETSPPKADAAMAQAAGAGSGAASAGAVAMDPASLQRRRQAIAQMLERTFYFRTLYN